MSWIVIGEKNQNIQLVSKGSSDTILPKGAYLTVENENRKFVLRVVGSEQDATYKPSAMIVDMEYNPLRQDRFSKNVLAAARVKQISKENDIFQIPVLSTARKSTQEEIDLVMGNKTGVRIFPAGVYANENKLLEAENGKLISVSLPDSMFYHQAMVCGATGSGKTVALKHLADYFATELEGAVIAINVKGVDLLNMEKASTTNSDSVKEEWNALGMKPAGMDNFSIYYPSNSQILQGRGVDESRAEKITLNVKSIDPESLTGLLHNITELAADFLPDIFRYWRNNETASDEYKFADFVNYFGRGREDDRIFKTQNRRGDINAAGVQLPAATYSNIERNLHSAAEFFDDPNASTIGAAQGEGDFHILEKGKLSVIDLHDEKANKFGAVLLRHLLKEIVEAKNKSEIPVLIIIDEVHRFYSNKGSKEALGTLDDICRTGRERKIGVIFASQNASDMPTGLSTVINSKIFFKSDQKSARDQGMNVTQEELLGLKAGYAIASIHNMPELKILKFPLASAGVFDE